MSELADPPIVNGPPVKPPPGTIITQSYFEEYLSHPWYVGNISLEDVPSIYSCYKEMMTNAKSNAEMEDVLSQFGWLAWDAKKSFMKHLAPGEFVTFDQIKEKSVTTGKLAYIALPKVMLYAFLVGERFKMPEFFAACQYLRASAFPDNNELDNKTGI